jgi:hypothetical protein
MQHPIVTSWDDLLEGVNSPEQWWEKRKEVKKRFLALLRDNAAPDPPQDMQLQVGKQWDSEDFCAQVIGDLRRRIEAGEYITIDIDLTGDVCKSKDDPNVTKGYFPQKKGKTGRQKAWAYITDADGKIQQLLVLEYGSGKMRLQHCLPPLLEKLVSF